MSRVTNLAEEIYLEQQRRAMSGSFGYGDFGIRKNENLQMGNAIADRIIEENSDGIADEPSLWDRITGAFSTGVSEVEGWSKARVDEAFSKFDEIVQKRKRLYNAINAMPVSAARDQAIAEFKEQEGVMTQYVLPNINKIFDALGEGYTDTSLPNNGNFGFLPAIWAAFVAAPVATQLIIAGALTVAIGYMTTVLAKYGTMLARPEIAKYDQGNGLLSSVLGTDATTKLVYGGLALLAVSMLWKKIA